MRVMAPVNSPTSVDQLACGTSGLRLRNLAFASPYQVHRATAPKAARRPTTLPVTEPLPGEAATAGMLANSSPAVTSPTGSASLRQA